MCNKQEGYFVLNHKINVKYIQKKQRSIGNKIMIPISKIDLELTIYKNNLVIIFGIGNVGKKILNLCHLLT